MRKRKDTLNSRGYVEMLNTAKNALKTIQKIEECSAKSMQKYGATHIDRPDFDFIFFDHHQLKMICFDYTFAALENFLVHVGFILCDDWDSKGKQRHYVEKIKKILIFNDIIEKRLPNEDYLALEKKWEEIFTSVDPALYTNRRNRVKHILSGNQEIKTQTVPSNSMYMNATEYDQLIANTHLDITKNHYIEFIEKLNNFINDAHSFLNQHKISFRIYSNPLNDETVKQRQRLLRTFLSSPWTGTLYTSEIAVS